MDSGKGFGATYRQLIFPFRIDFILVDNIWSTYKNKFDLTMIYNYFVYNLSSTIEKVKYFEQFNNISKQNIQFIYWWRNKIANQIFLRYKRNQVNNRPS